MNIFSGLQSFMFGPGVSYLDHMQMGAYYTLSGDFGVSDASHHGSAGPGTGTRFNFLGHAVEHKPGSGVKMTPNVYGSPGAIGYGFAGFSAINVASGFYTGGLTGAFTAAIDDVQITGAVARYGHMGVNINGTHSVNFGNIGAGRGLYERLYAAGGKSKRIAQAMGVGSYASRIAGAAVGHSVATGLLGGAAYPISGAVGAALGAKYAPAMWAGAAIVGGGYMAARGLYSVAKTGHDWTQSKKGIGTHGDMLAFSTQGAHTMRERAVQEIQKSFLNARSALGQEASLLHNPHKSYHSRFRAR